MMCSYRSVFTLFILLFLTLGLAACGSSAPTSTHTPTLRPTSTNSVFDIHCYAHAYQDADRTAYTNRKTNTLSRPDPIRHARKRNC